MQAGAVVSRHRERSVAIHLSHGGAPICIYRASTHIVKTDHYKNILNMTPKVTRFGLTFAF